MRSQQISPDFLHPYVSLYASSPLVLFEAPLCAVSRPYPALGGYA